MKYCRENCASRENFTAWSAFFPGYLMLPSRWPVLQFCKLSVTVSNTKWFLPTDVQYFIWWGFNHLPSSSRGQLCLHLQIFVPLLICNGVFSWDPLSSFVEHLMISRINNLHEIFNMCSLYTYMRVLILSSSENDFLTVMPEWRC